jgi:hypothetical protein
MPRPMPPRSQWGSWDVLPEDTPATELDLTNPDVKDGLERRERLKQQWSEFYTYPHGVWREDDIERDPDEAEAWRNWLLRRAWESIAITNGSLRAWSENSVPQ